MSRLPALLGLSAATALAGVGIACSSSRPPPAIVAPGPDGGGDDGGGGFSFQQLGCGSAGTQSAIAVSGTKIGVASLAATTMTKTCTIMPLGPPMTSQVPVWNVCYAESQADGTSSSTVVSSQPYVAPTGVGVAFDSTGSAGVAFTGVGATPAAERCGANDAFLAKATGGTFGTPLQISHGSASDGLVAAQAANCSQGVCSSGDVTGWWPAIAFDANDNATMAYRDVHFGFSNDDLFAKTDVELARGSGGSYPVLTVDVSRGGGIYNRVAFTPAGMPAVLQYNTGGKPGVYIDRAMTAGGLAAQEADGGWAAAQIFSGQVDPQLGFDINGQGLFAAAYHDTSTTRLFYVESTDGLMWSAPVTVDVDGTTGLYPSLAFDSSGDPAVAYYRCNGTHGMSQCDPTQDGLYLARRKGGAWNAQVVQADPGVTDGLYPALAFVNDKAVIAFQVTTFDAVAQTSTPAWWIAEEQ